MEFKLTIQGALVYAMMAASAGAFGAYLYRARRLGRAIFLVAFLLGVGALAYRTLSTGQPPMRNLFDIFLCLAVVSYPGSLLCRYGLGIGGEAEDPLLALILLVPVGFVFSARPERLPPALQHWLWTPHVATYMAAYLVMFKASLQGLRHLWRADPLGKDDSALIHEESAYKLVLIGFPLMTAGLLLGAFWGKIAWGDYWNWDPKEVWSLAGWLVYVNYIHFRTSYRQRYPRVNSTLAVLGGLTIVITLLWVNLSQLFQGLHSYA